jgi:ribosomal protein L40E
MSAQVFMLIECPKCAALMRNPAKFCRRCGRGLSRDIAGKKSGVDNGAGNRAKSVIVLCGIGAMVIIWAIVAGSVDRSIIGIILFLAGVGTCREKTQENS